MKQRKTKSKLVDITVRCHKELSNSTSRAMLMVAKKYSDLFLKQLRDKNVDNRVINVIKERLDKAYKGNHYR